MQKTTPSPTTSGSPFFDLLAEAEEIKIREVPPEAEAPQSNCRTFLIRITNPPAPTPAPAKPSESKETPENRNYLLKSADLLVVDKDYILARNIYSYLLKLNIRDEAAMKGLGTCFLRLGDNGSAKKCFRALHEISRSPESQLWLGNCLVAEGQEAAALEEFRKIEDPTRLSVSDQFDLHREMGNCETRAQKYEAAWAHYHQALKLNPQSDIIHVNLGTLELQRQNVDIAYSYFTMALKQNPKSSRAHCGLGLVAVAKKDLGIAKKEFELSLDLDSQNLVALFQLVHLSAEEENIGDIRTRIEAYLQKDPRQCDVRYAFAVLLFRDGEWAACSKEISALLALDPQHAKAKALRDQLTSHKHLPA